MKVFLTVAVDVFSRKPDRSYDPQVIRELVQEAIFNALDRAGDSGFDHKLSDEVGLLVDYVGVSGSDMEDEF